MTSTNTITLRASTYYSDGEARSTTAHDWRIETNGSGGAPACATNRRVWTRNEPQVVFLRDGAELCRDCADLRAAKP